MLILLLFLVTKILNISDWNDTMKVLVVNDFPNHKWHKIGVNLNIKYNQLQDIEKDKRECYDRLCECLAVWLKTGRATYKELIEAVRGIKETAVADAIEKHLSKK